MKGNQKIIGKLNSLLADWAAEIAAVTSYSDGIKRKQMVIQNYLVKQVD